MDLLPLSPENPKNCAIFPLSIQQRSSRLTLRGPTKISTYWSWTGQVRSSGLRAREQLKQRRVRSGLNLGTPRLSAARSRCSCSRRKLMDINECPVFVLLSPSINHAQKDLPITIFESVNMRTVEAERISVDHVAHLKPSHGGSAATQLAAHLTGTHRAIKMLNRRIRVLHHYLLAMEKGITSLTLKQFIIENLRSDCLLTR
ncbi:hypothetical protein AgCh_010205 [Apium graveolens]